VNFSYSATFRNGPELGGEEEEGSNYYSIIILLMLIFLTQQHSGTFFLTRQHSGAALSLVAKKKMAQTAL
jgi:hypothetical protein